MNVLVFSDTHGRIPLMLRIAWQFQRERATTVDLIMVTGDLGVWPDLSRLDDSTRKYCQWEPAELGFLCFQSFLEIDNTDHELYPHTALRQASRLLDHILPDLKAPVVFVGGNHEDYVYLLTCRDRQPFEIGARHQHGLLKQISNCSVPVRFRIDNRWLVGH